MEENNTQSLPAVTGEGLSLEKVTEIMQGAYPTLQESNQRADRCEKRLAELLTNEKQAGMSEELDKLFADFITRATATLKYINEKRKPFTVILDNVKKEFTGTENRLKAAIEQAQERRNAHARVLAEKKAAEERAAAEKLRKEQERINVQKQVESDFMTAFNNAITTYKQRLSDLVNNATLETLAKNREQVKEPYNFSMFWHELSTHEVGIKSDVVTQSEQFSMRRDYVEVNHKELEGCFNYECEGYRTYIDMKFDERKMELEVIARADAENKAKLEQQAAERAAKEKERLEAERAEAERKAKEQAEVAAQQRSLESQMNNQVSLFQGEKRNDKESVAITADQAGYMEMAMQWFEVEGKGLDIAKFEKMTFARIKAWCEKYTEKNGVAINSTHVHYGTKVTAK